MKSSDAIVVGGGIIGLFTAWELQRSGRSVTLLERGPLAREASWAGGGILCPLYPWRVAEPVWRLAQAGLDSWPAIAGHLHQATGVDPEYRISGLRILRTEDAAAGAIWARQQGLQAEAAADSGLWLPQIAQVRNPRLCRALATQLRSLGVRLLEQQPVTGLLQNGDEVEGVMTADGGRWRAPLVCICAGAWSAAPALSAGLALAIQPVRGQMLLLSAAVDALREMRLGEDRYLIPRRDGRVLVGSTIEHGGFEQATTAAARATLLQAVEWLAPALRAAPVEAHWSGLRPGSPDGIPAIGRHPDLDGLWFNAGHFRNGICMAPAAAALLAALIDGRETAIPAQPYDPRAIVAINPSPARWPRAGAAG